MKVHLGHLIKQIVLEKGLTISEFSNMIGTSRSNVHDIFNREYLDTNLLAKISKALDFNFFSLFEDPTSVTATLVFQLDPEELKNGNYQEAFCKNCPIKNGRTLDQH